MERKGVLLNNMKFIKLTNNLQKYFIAYQEKYGTGALIAYLEGYLKGLKKHE